MGLLLNLPILYLGHEGYRVDRLKGLGTTLIAGVGGNLHHWFHLSGSGHDPLDRDQLPNLAGLDLPDRQHLVRGLGLEVHLKPPHQFWWKDFSWGLLHTGGNCSLCALSGGLPVLDEDVKGVPARNISRSVLR